jgi:hypothetical protein
MVVIPFALAHRNYATVRHFALFMFELDRGVVDAEVAMQAVFHVAQDALTYRGWNIGDGDVAGERPRFRANAPHVEIVHVVDSADRADRVFHQFQLQATRRAFQLDI